MQNKVITIVFLFFVFSVTLIPGAEILGDWESLYFYHNFAPLEFYIDFKISPRANIGNPGYSVLEISRLLIENLGLELNLSNFRLPSKIFSILTIFTFVIILKRLYGLKTAILTSAILFSNPIFYLYMNTSIIVMASAFGFVLLLERLQKIDENYTSLFHWMTLSVPLVLISLNYGLVRIYSAIIIIFWVLKFYLNCKKKNVHGISLSYFFRRFFITLFISILFLSILNKENFYSLLFFPTFFIPQSSESFLLSNIIHKGQTLNLGSAFLINLKIIFETLTGFEGNYHDKALFNVLAGYRYPILNIFSFLIFFLGLILCLKNLHTRKQNHNISNISLIIVLIICSILILTSTIFKSEEGLSISISNHRFFFLLFPIFSFLGYLINYVLKKSNNSKILTSLTYIVVVALLTLNINKIFEDKDNFKNILSNNLKNKNPTTSWNTWVENKNYKGDVKKLTKHFDHHLNYLKLAKKINLLTNDKKKESLILKIDTNKFFFNKSPNFHFLNNYEFNTFFLSFYLNNLNMKTAWVQNINTSTKINIIGFSKNSVFPVNLNQSKLPLIPLKDEKNKFVLRNYNREIYPKIILVENSDQQEFASNFLKKKSVDFSIINF